MLVEPERLCWLTGRMVPARDGATWAEEFARLPALKSVVRDAGTGPGKGLCRERARRRAARCPDRDDTLDVVPTPPRGGTGAADDLGRGDPRPGTRRGRPTAG